MEQPSWRFSFQVKEGRGQQTQLFFFENHPYKKERNKV